MTSLWRSRLGTQFPKELIDHLDEEHHKILRSLRADPGNAHCADCGDSDTTWASVNLGVFLCVQCADIHRALGSHVSKVKTCAGTGLWGPDEIANMQCIGNAKSAQTFGGVIEYPKPGTVLSKAEVMRLTSKKYALQRGSSINDCPPQHTPKDTSCSTVDLASRAGGSMHKAVCMRSNGWHKQVSCPHALSRKDINFDDFGCHLETSDCQQQCIPKCSMLCPAPVPASRLSYANRGNGALHAKELSLDDFILDEFFTSDDATNNFVACNQTSSKTCPSVSCVQVISPSQLKLAYSDDELWAGFDDL